MENSCPCLQVEPHFILKNLICIIININERNRFFFFFFFFTFQGLIKNMQIYMLFHVIPVDPFKLYWLGL